MRSGQWTALFLAVLVWAMAPAVADTLHLTGQLVDERGRPRAGESFRLVLGSEAVPRAPEAGRILRTDGAGRFALTAPVSLPARRIRLGSQFGRHDSRLLELGFGFDLIGQPALYWVEVDFTRHGPLRGIAAFVAGRRGAFDQPLTFHARQHAWSIPGEPRGLRLSDIGADLSVVDWTEGADDGVWRLDVLVTRQEFQMR